MLKNDRRARGVSVDQVIFVDKHVAARDESEGDDSCGGVDAHGTEICIKPDLTAWIGAIKGIDERTTEAIHEIGDSVGVDAFIEMTLATQDCVSTPLGEGPLHGGIIPVASRT